MTAWLNLTLWLRTGLLENEECNDSFSKQLRHWGVEEGGVLRNEVKCVGVPVVFTSFSGVFKEKNEIGRAVLISSNGDVCGYRADLVEKAYIRFQGSTLQRFVRQSGESNPDALVLMSQAAPLSGTWARLHAFCAISQAYPHPRKRC